ncbi:calcium-binding protein [Nocardioides nitrophenolicus]|uniref:calcium-binding protein n=1 Tax=Nocardioides nitrophenolicus TaxID=60489 RepID=UPI001956AF5A|nr:calcium-binding protein [Nocardioides nitrophenolicus]MBM7517248.1 Ca2+-binding RTX toxin-like protein [Nocardioides nitrophenolicus]
MRRTLLPVLALALALPASIGITAGAEAAKPRCGGLKATIVGTNKADRITGTPGRDVIVGRGGNDRIDGKGGRDVICGGGGNDRIRSGPGKGGLLFGDAGRDLLVAEADDTGLYGGAGNDVLRTTRAATLLDGGAGDDVLEGGPFPDTIDGGPGNDRIMAGGGDDRLVTGGAGDDTVDGGEGTDVLRGGPGNDVITLGPGAGGAGYGEDGADTMATGADGQALYGGEGNDVLKTAWARTTLDGQGGDDELHGGPEPDVISGGDGNDRISGGGGDDIELNGGFGIDVCDGGPGRDVCNGGAPGGPENSPTDPDVCTAEVTRSCRGEQLPERWFGTLSGTTYNDYGAGAVDIATWRLRMTLVRQKEFDGKVFYELESASGDYTASRAGTCTFDAAAAYDQSELWADLRVPLEGTGYSIEVGGPEQLEVTLVCPTSQRPHVVALFTGGRVLDGVRDPETGRIFGGSRLDLGEGYYREWQFDLGSTELP